MHYKEYEEQWFDGLRKIMKKGYKLSDCKVGLGLRLNIRLDSELPLLRSSYIPTETYLPLFIKMRDIFEKSELEGSFDRKTGIKEMFAKTDLTIFKGFSCLVDVDGKLHFSVVLDSVNWVTELPVIVAATSLFCRLLCKTTGLDRGNLHVLCNKSLLNASQDALNSLLQNRVFLSSLDHDYTHYAIREEYLDPTDLRKVDILNYSVGENSYNTIVPYTCVV